MLRRQGSRFSLRLLSVAGLAAVVLSGCGASGSRRVASVATGGGTESTATAPPARGSPIQLLDDWAACMRDHGDPGQADPSIDPQKVIHIPWNPAVEGGYNGTNKGGQGNSGPGQYCRTYLTDAQRALQGGQAPKLPDTAKLVEFSNCMRAHGVHDFPDPTSRGLVLDHGGDLNPNNTTFRRASDLCARQIGVPGLASDTPHPGTIELTNP